MWRASCSLNDPESKPQVHAAESPNNIYLLFFLPWHPTYVVALMVFLSVYFHQRNGDITRFGTRRRGHHMFFESRRDKISRVSLGFVVFRVAARRTHRHGHWTKNVEKEACGKSRAVSQTPRGASSSVGLDNLYNSHCCCCGYSLTPTRRKQETRPWQV